MTERGRVLLVDDEARILKTLSRALADDGHDVVTLSSAKEASRRLLDSEFDVLVADNRMPDMTGIELVSTLVAGTRADERPEIIMMTAHATVANALEAMKLGAFDYLQKPFEVDELLVVVRRALKHLRLTREHSYLLTERRREFNEYGLVGESDSIGALREKIKRIASSKSTVLITGETGTGKELVARAIHDQSAEREQPLIKVNCAAIPETLLESELFGHVKGAFTNAISNKRGKFSLANGSTLFLDEIGMMSVQLQAKLLRVLQEREFEPLGSERTERVDLRILAATNRDLSKLIAEGSFQEDLYYRLSVIPLEISPLRERPDDIPLLVSHFVEKHGRRLGRSVEGVTEAALERLKAYAWPGNVRELENTIERAVVLSGASELGHADLTISEGSQGSSSSLPSLRLHDNVEWVEQESIRRALKRANGIKKVAAESLGVSQRALSYYLRKYRID